MSLALPWEVIERVIGHSSNSIITLYSFTLTCRALNPRSTIVLLGRVELKSRKQIFSFCDVLNAKPHLRHVVRTITMLPLGFSPHPLLRLLDNLSEIKFTSSVCYHCPFPRGYVYPHPIASRNPRASSTVLHSSVATYCRLFGDHIQSLALQHMSFSSLSSFSRFLLSFPKIKSLHFSHLVCADNDPHLELVTRRVSQRMHLETLTVEFHNMSSGILTLLGQAAKYTVRKLKLYAKGSSMKCADIPLMFLGISPSSSWVQLNSLTLRITLGSDYLAVDHEEIVATLNHLGHPAKLREVVIDLQSIPEVADIIRFLHFFPNSTKWPELETMLLRFPKPNIRFSLDRPINFRTRNFWGCQVEKCFPALATRGAVTFKAEYSGKVGHESRITTPIVASVDGRWAATGSDDDTIIIWDINSGSISQEWFVQTLKDRPTLEASPMSPPMPSFAPHPHSLAFSPDSRYLLSIGLLPGVTVWDLHRNSRKVVSLGGEYDHEVIHRCAWSPDGSFILAEFSNAIVRTWKAGTFNQPLHPQNTWSGELLAVSPDGRWVLTGLSHLGVIWDVASGKPHTTALYGHTSSIVAAAFDPSSTRVVTGSLKLAHLTIRVWDVESGQAILALTDGLQTDLLIALCRRLAYPRDGKMVSSSFTNAASGSRIRIWDASNKTLRSYLFAAPDSDRFQDTLNFTISGRTTCFSPCGRYVASISAEGSAALWRVRGGPRIAEITGNGSPVEHIAITRDGRVVCCGCQDGTVIFRRLCDLVPAYDL